MAPRGLCGLDFHQDKGNSAEKGLLGRFVALFQFFVSLGETEGRCAARRHRLVIGRLLTIAWPAAVTIPIGLLARSLSLIESGLTLTLDLRAALRHQDAKIMFRMLEIVLRLHTVSGRSRVARELEIFLVNMSRRATDFHVRTCRVEGAVVGLLLRSSAAST